MDHTQHSNQMQQTDNDRIRAFGVGVEFGVSNIGCAAQRIMAMAAVAFPAVAFRLDALVVRLLSPLRSQTQSRSPNTKNKVRALGQAA